MGLPGRKSRRVALQAIGSGGVAEPVLPAAAEPLDLVLDRGVGDAELLGNLAVAGAGEDAPEERGQQPGASEPVAGRERL